METITILDQDIEVDITHYNPGCEAKINCLPENATPAEGAEIEWELTDCNSEFVIMVVENMDNIHEEITELLLDIMVDTDFSEDEPPDKEDF